MSSHRKKLIIGFSFISVLTIFFTLAGISIFKESGYQSNAIIWFSVTSSISLISIGVLIYNIIKYCRENNQYSPLATSTTPPNYYDD